MSAEVIELFVSCPVCKTFETVWLKGNKLVPTRKFRQSKRGRIYHDCGSEKPCLLFPKLWGESFLDRYAGR